MEKNHIYPINMFNAMLLLHNQIDIIYDIKKYIMQLYVHIYCKSPLNIFHFSCLCSSSIFNMDNKKTIDNNDIFIFNDRYYGWTPTQIFTDAFTNQRFDVVEFIINDVKDDHVCQILHNLYRLGKLEILKKYFIYSLYSGNHYLLQLCCMHNHCNIAEFMLSVSKFTQYTIFEIFIEQCKLNHLKMVRLLTSTRHVYEHVIKNMIVANEYEALELACFYNSTDVFFWLEHLLIRYQCNPKLLIKKYEKDRFKCHPDMQPSLKQMIINFKLIKAIKN
uniref:Ankyrin repeat protein n=1 Tax=viral metagenome TaxID=1070528 RepID=A0A6C0CAW6_9ZZZZ